MLFFNDTTTLMKAGLLRGMTDFHCHLLPGVDDGIRHIKHTLQVLEYHESIGFTDVWCTPHIMEDVPNPTTFLKEQFAELQEQYKGNIKLHLGAEYMLDNEFLNHLNSNDLLPLGEDLDHLLVETRTFNAPSELESILCNIKSAGYFPILAHPERYIYMTKDDYLKWKDMDVKLQLNVPSLAGIYGKEEKAKAEWLLANDMYDFYGTDLHNSHHIAGTQFPLEDYTIRKKLVKNMKKLIETAQ